MVLSGNEKLMVQAVASGQHLVEDEIENLYNEYSSRLKDIEIKMLKLDAYDDIEQENKIYKTLDNGIIAIIKNIFFLNINTSTNSESVTGEAFLNSLTNMERKAFFELVKRSGVSGRVSIDGLRKEAKISRPVFDKLIAKIRKSGVATIVGHGNSGSDITIVDPGLIELVRQKNG
jgi:hypothetical protein